jgi:hypothetical protein
MTRKKKTRVAARADKRLDKLAKLENKLTRAMDTLVQDINQTDQMIGDMFGIMYVQAEELDRMESGNE